MSETWRFGPVGFTQVEEVQAILRPYREKSIREMTYFDGLTAADLVRLVDLLPATNTEAHANSAPSLQDVAAVARAVPTLRFFGYVVGPERSDERVSVEGLYCPPEDAQSGALDRLLEEYRPDEAWSVEYHGATMFRAWWD